MNFSPLRYPGGKSKIAPLVRLTIQKTNCTDVTYIEPFAGGAGVALNLLFDGTVNRIVINDYDKAIYSFWRALKENTQALINLIERTPVNIEEWKKQKKVYLTQNHSYSLELGFAAFFLNRTNRSGIIGAGPIGGYDQSGNFKIDARYNKVALIKRVKKIAEQKKNIIVYNKEIRNFISRIVPKYQESAFIYFDPPYYEKGKRLYKNFFSHSDHAAIAYCIFQCVNCDWIITYDDVPQLREIYSLYTMRKYDLNYSVANKGKGSEIIIFKTPNLLPASKEIQESIGNFHIDEL
jgi:DNA adenine methylase